MDQSTEKKLPVLEHLVELRNILVFTVVALLVAFCAIFALAIKPLMELLQGPIIERGITMMFSSPSEAFTTQMWVALIASIVVIMPVITWRVWRFISPALYSHEKRAFWGIFLMMVFLFMLGVVFCYFAVYELTLDFFIQSADGVAEPLLSIHEYINFMVGFVVPFGIAFELPVVLYVTTRLGLTNYKMLASKRKYIILGVAVVAAFLTPPDVVSQSLLGIPILLLFEISLQVCRFVKPGKKKSDEEEAEQSAEEA